jgi:predicted MFS family arabinose efflux permease
MQSSAQSDEGGSTYRVLTVTFLLATSFAVLLPVVPVMVERRGHPGEAGAATAVLLASTVLAEVVTPALMARFSSRSLVLVALVLAGLPSMLYSIPDLEVVPILMLTSFRGAGVGFGGVVCMALISQLAKPNRRGAAVGLYGFVATTPLVVFPSVGLFLLGVRHLESAGALSALAATVAGVVALGLPRRDMSAAIFSLRPGLGFLRGGLIGLVLSLAIVSMSFGGVISFIPLTLPTQGLASSVTFLLVAGTARTASRWLSGEVGDRYRPSSVVLVGIVVSALGLAVLRVSSAAPFLIAAAASYGGGFGAVQAGTYLRMLQRTTAAEVRVVTAAWYIAMDFGTAAGAAIFGVVAAGYGYAAVYWLLPLMVAAALPIAMRAMHDDGAG